MSAHALPQRPTHESAAAEADALLAKAADAAANGDVVVATALRDVADGYTRLADMLAHAWRGR